MLDAAPLDETRMSSGDLAAKPMPAGYLSEIDTTEEFEGYTQKQRDTLRSAAWSVEQAPGLQTARDDIPGFRLAGTLRSRETVLFYGVTEEGKRLVGSATLTEPEGDDTKDMTAETAEAMLVRRDSFARAHGRFSRLSAQTDWLTGYPKDLERVATQRSKAILAAIGQQDDARNVRMIDRLLEDERERPRSGLRSDVVAALDPEVQEVLKQTRQEENGRTIDWLTAPGKTIETPAGPKTIHPRADALRQVGWIANFVTDVHDDYIDYFFHGMPSKMTAQIDEGRSVVDVVAETFSVKKPLINRLRKLPLEKYTNISQIPYEIQKLDKIANPTQIEGTEKGLEDAIRVTSAAEVYEQVTGHGDALQGANGNLKQLTKCLQDQPAQGLADMAQYLNDKLVVPAFWHICRDQGQPVDAAVENAIAMSRECKFLEGLTFSQAYRNTAEWHKRLTGINHRTQSRHAVSSWEPYVGQIDLGDGIIAHELCTAEALTAEGDAQDHCVGGYTPSVLAGRSLVFSLRREDEILSTVEISSVEQRGSLDRGMKVNQNLGKENSFPDEGTKIAGQTLLRKLKRLPEERLDTYLAGVATVQKEVAERKAYDRLEMNIAQYEVKDRRNVEKMFGELAQFLPKEDAREGFDAWARKQYARAAQKPPAQTRPVAESCL